jgi:hypothetical protein
MQVKTLPLKTCLVPTFGHFVPAVTAECALGNVEKTIKAVARKKARHFFISEDYP